MVRLVYNICAGKQVGSLSLLSIYFPMARPKKYKKKVKFKLKKESVQSLVALVCFALSGLTLMAFVGQAAGAGNILQTWVSMVVGWASFMVPVILLSLGLTLSRIQWSIAKPNVLLGLILFIIGLAAILHPISSLFVETSALARAQMGVGGGVVGYTLFAGLAEFVTPLGAWFLLLLWLTGACLVIFNTSLSTIFEKSSGAATASKGALSNMKKPALKKQKDDGDAPAFAVNVAGSKLAPVATASGADRPDPSEALNSTQVLSNEAGEQVIWDYPPFTLLSNASSKSDPGDLKGTAATIERTLESFGILAKVVEVNVSPTVTQYALELASGTKIAKITTLANDLASAVMSKSGAVRVEAPIPGKSLVGIEIPNQKSATVGLRSILESSEAKEVSSRLALPLGQSVSGHPVVADLAKMPHLLVAGTTGSGKSVAINAFVTALLMRNSPSELKLILVDPKFVEMTSYNGIPHLLTPVITDMDKVVSALKWSTAEMDRRYKALAAAGAKNIESYNEISGFQALPYIVIIIDEMADLMMTAPAEVEDAIVRIAQKARAVGIHLILATQRPSANVITGLIKANIPGRLSFAVNSNVDSRVILDQPGAEKLLGKGDMLYLSPDSSRPQRIQGNWVKDEEIGKVLDFVKGQGVTPDYTDEVITQPTQGGVAGVGGDNGDRDPLFNQALEIIASDDKASSSLLMRRLKVGYARSARILDELEMAGYVGPADGSKPRQVLMRNSGEVQSNPEAEF